MTYPQAQYEGSPPEGYAPPPQAYAPPAVEESYSYPPPVAYVVPPPAPYYEYGPPYGAVPGPYYGRGAYWRGYPPHYAYGYGHHVIGTMVIGVLTTAGGKQRRIRSGV
jgi:hypothetical protein